MQHIGIIRTFCLPEGTKMFFSAWGQKKLQGFWFARGDQYPGWVLLCKKFIWRSLSRTGRVVLRNQFHEPEQSFLVLVSLYEYKVRVLSTQIFSMIKCFFNFGWQVVKVTRIDNFFLFYQNSSDLLKLYGMY